MHTMFRKWFPIPYIWKVHGEKLVKLLQDFLPEK